MLATDSTYVDMIAAYIASQLLGPLLGLPAGVLSSHEAGNEQLLTQLRGVSRRVVGEPRQCSDVTQHLPRLQNVTVTSDNSCHSMVVIDALALFSHRVN